ncbi:MAG: adenylosuccinate lyase [Candidatus Lokiarchaeota archaeon]|nr:adenylosuccinate lyase [Candidatus Lokiarchaeota archaeon]
MSVHPIEYRYFTKEMKDIFNEENKLAKWLKVEAALARAHAEVGNISEENAAEIEKKADIKIVKLSRVKEIEKEIDHDIMAMVRGLSEVCKGDAGKYVHLGATSYDIVDTAWSLILKDALELILKRVITLKSLLLKWAEKHKSTICIGRTHGQHAVPTTYGMKFALFGSEIYRHENRLKMVIEKNLVGKMSGAVGTMASFGDKGFQIQKKVMKYLRLKESPISNQIIQRDYHAEIFSFLALIGATLSKIAKEIRNLQRTEIGELFEPYGKSKQVGSSTMAAKRNPHKSERICGLYRVLEGQLITVFNNAALIEHERDLTNSASERVVFPETFILLDYMLTQMIKIIDGLEFNLNNIKKNIDLTKGQIFAENIMIKLVEKGLNRQEAHEKLREIAIACRDQDISYKQGILNDDVLKNLISLEDLDAWLDPKNYIGTAVKQVENIIKECK